MINSNYFKRSNCRSIYTKIEYIPTVYFLKPLNERLVNFYCTVENINFILETVSLKAYSYEYNEVEMYLDVHFSEFSIYELPFLSYCQFLIVDFSVGDFILFKNNQYKIKEESRIEIKPLFRNYNYYKTAIKKQIEIYNKVLGNNKK